MPHSSRWFAKDLSAPLTGLTQKILRSRAALLLPAEHHCHFPPLCLPVFFNPLTLQRRFGPLHQSDGLKMTRYGCACRLLLSQLPGRVCRVVATNSGSEVTCSTSGMKRLSCNWWRSGNCSASLHFHAKLYNSLTEIFFFFLHSITLLFLHFYTISQRSPAVTPGQLRWTPSRWAQTQRQQEFWGSLNRKHRESAISSPTCQNDGRAVGLHHTRALKIIIFWH